MSISPSAPIMYWVALLLTCELPMATSVSVGRSFTKIPISPRGFSNHYECIFIYLMLTNHSTSNWATWLIESPL